MARTKKQSLAGMICWLVLASAAALAAAQDEAPVDAPIVGPPADVVADLPDAAIDQIEETRARVAAVKEEVRAALANRDAAWDAFLADKQAKIAAARDQIEETRARVAAVKEEVRAALANRDAAWDAFLADKQAKIAAARADGQVPRGLALLEDDIAAGPPALGRRKQVFVRNLQDINRRNADADDLLAFGINDFTHLSAKEFKDVYLTSVLPSADIPLGGGSRKLLQTASVLQCNKQVAFSFGTVTPRNLAHSVTSVKNQNTCGSCAAFAATAAVETAWIAKYNTSGWNTGNTDLSEQDLLSCTVGNGCLGAAPEVYVDRLTCRGAALEANAPYLNVDNTTTCPTVTRYVAGVTGWAYAPNNERGFAQALTHNPFIFGVSGRDLQSYSAGVYGCGGTNAVDHVLTMVGYTMNVTMSTGAKWNVFRAKNSWGGAWGESGFVRFRADCTGTGSLQIFNRSGILPIRG